VIKKPGIWHLQVLTLIGKSDNVGWKKKKTLQKCSVLYRFLLHKFLLHLCQNALSRQGHNYSVIMFMIVLWLCASNPYPQPPPQGCSQAILHPICICAWECLDPGAGPCTFVLRLCCLLLTRKSMHNYLRSLERLSHTLHIVFSSVKFLLQDAYSMALSYCMVSWTSLGILPAPMAHVCLHTQNKRLFPCYSIPKYFLVWGLPSLKRTHTYDTLIRANNSVFWRWQNLQFNPMKNTSVSSTEAVQKKWLPKATKPQVTAFS